MKRKVDVDHPDYPPKRFAGNWKLSEFHYTHNLGKKTKTTFTMDENLNRTASDLASGTAMLGDEVKPKNQKDPAQVHRLHITRITTLCAKLAKAMGQTESALPMLKKKMMEDAYVCLKSGLCQCREFKCTTLEDLEDWKPMPESEEEQEAIINKMVARQKELTEHLEALKDALSKAQADHPDAIIKLQPATASEDGDRFFTH